MKTEQEALYEIKNFENNIEFATFLLTTLRRVLSRCILTPDVLDANSASLQDYQDAADSWTEFRVLFKQLIKTEDTTSTLFANNIEIALERGKLINSLKNQ